MIWGFYWQTWLWMAITSGVGIIGEIVSSL